VYNEFKVKLRSQVTNTVVAFDVTPDISESRTVNYKTLEPVHMPGGIHVYGNTSSRTFSISNIRLVSRTREEASKNLYRLNLMRSWAMPYFGVNNTSLVGAPPDVLALSAYATGLQDSANTMLLESSADRRTRRLEGVSSEQDINSNKRTRATNIQNVPVVLQSINIPYPSDVDYIDTMDWLAPDHTLIDRGVPFPTIMIIDLQLLETHSPREYANFDLKAYKQGLLDNF